MISETHDLTFHAFFSFICWNLTTFPCQRRRISASPATRLMTTRSGSRDLSTDWSRLITWPKYWPLIGQDRSRDLNIRSCSRRESGIPRLGTRRRNEQEMMKWWSYGTETLVIILSNLSITVNSLRMQQFMYFRRNHEINYEETVNCHKVSVLQTGLFTDQKPKVIQWKQRTLYKMYKLNVNINCYKWKSKIYHALMQTHSFKWDRRDKERNVTGNGDYKSDYNYSFFWFPDE